MCAKVRTVLFLPRRVLLTTVVSDVVSDERDFSDYGGDGPRRSAAIAGRTRHGSGRFGCQPFQVQLQVQRREAAVYPFGPPESAFLRVPNAATS